MAMQKSPLSRREFLRFAAVGAGGAALAACSQPPQVVEKVVTKEVEKVVKETVQVEKVVTKEVEKVVTKEVEKVVTPTPPGGKEPVKIQLMVWGGADRAQNSLINPFKEAFPEVASWLTVEPVSPGNHDAEVYQFMRLALAAGTGLPELVQMNYIGVPEFAEADLLTDLTELMAPYKDDLLEGTKTLAVYKDKYVTIPREVKTKLWYYRKDMFEKAGIDVAAVKTYEDYMAAGQKLHKAFPDSFIMNIGPQPIHYWYFMLLTHWDTEEIRVAKADGKYNIVGNEHYKTMLTWLKDWYSSGIAFKTDDWSSDWQPAFANNVIAGDLVSQWMDLFLPGFAPQQKGLWAKTLWPEFNRSGSEAGGAVWVIPAGVEHPKEGFLFASLLYLDKDSAVRAWKVQTGTLPNIKSAKDEVLKLAETYERPSGMTDDQWAQQPINFFGKDYMNSHYEAQKYLKVFPYDPKASAELDIMRKNTEAFLAGQKTLEEALAGAQKDMEAQLGNPYAK